MRAGGRSPVRYTFSPSVEKVQTLFTVVDDIKWVTDAVFLPRPFGGNNIMLIVLSQKYCKRAFLHSSSFCVLGRATKNVLPSPA